VEPNVSVLLLDLAFVTVKPVVDDAIVVFIVVVAAPVVVFVGVVVLLKSIA
jgi:hypothetical protein